MNNSTKINSSTPLNKQSFNFSENVAFSPPAISIPYSIYTPNKTSLNSSLGLKYESPFLSQNRISAPVWLQSVLVSSSIIPPSLTKFEQSENVSGKISLSQTHKLINDFKI
jgi:hypothetical protein